MKAPPSLLKRSSRWWVVYVPDWMIDQTSGKVIGGCGTCNSEFGDWLNASNKVAISVYVERMKARVIPNGGMRWMLFTYIL